MSSSEYDRSIREEDLRRFVSPGFVHLFDQDFYQEFGRWPTGSPMSGTTPQRNDPRRAKIQALADQSPFEGERAAAQRMLDNMDAAAGMHAATMDRLNAEASSFGSYD